jgi:SAM-dependent methyltransferase
MSIASSVLAQEAWWVESLQAPESALLNVDAVLWMFGHKAKDHFQRVNNMCCELQLGISTRGKEVAKLAKPDAVHYATINYSAIHNVLRRLQLQQSDTFVDIGCGKGRVLCCAARHRCNEVIGIEYDEKFCAEARANSLQLRRRKAPISVHHGNAEQFDYSRATVLYLFNPFGPRTLNTVLHKVSVDTCRRQLRIAFVTPPEAQDAVEAVFTGHAWLKRYDGWPLGTNGRVLFYRRNSAD